MSSAQIEDKRSGIELHCGREGEKYAENDFKRR